MGKSYYDDVQRSKLISDISAKFGSIISKEKILEFVETNALPNPHFLLSNRDIKVGKNYDKTIEKNSH